MLWGGAAVITLDSFYSVTCRADEIIIMIEQSNLLHVVHYPNKVVNGIFDDQKKIYNSSLHYC